MGQSKREERRLEKKEVEKNGEGRVAVVFEGKKKKTKNTVGEGVDLHVQALLP